jgi:hypothetical protein
MRQLFTITFLFVVCFNANSAIKEYQQILVNEPASLLDLTMFKANLKAEAYKETLDYKKNVSGQVIRNLRRFDFDRQLSTLDFDLPISFPEQLYARFDFGNGLFYFEQALIWRLRESIDKSDNPNLPELISNQKNITLVCNILLKNMAHLIIAPETHAGYTTKASRKLPENLLAQAINDTVYRVTIYLQNTYEDYPSLECETTGKERYIEDGKIEYKYNGAWFELDKIINKVRVKNKLKSK